MKSVETDLVGNRVEVERKATEWLSHKQYKYTQTAGRVRAVTLEHDCLTLYIETETEGDASINQSEIGDVIRRNMNDGDGPLTLKIKNIK